MSFDLHHPTTLAEAIDLARRLAPAARFVAGGTDLVIQINRKKAAPAHLIDISRLPGLAGIAETADGFARPVTTYRTIERHRAFQGTLSSLVEAAGVVGGHQRTSQPWAVHRQRVSTSILCRRFDARCEPDIAGPLGTARSVRNFIPGLGKPIWSR